MPGVDRRKIFQDGEDFYASYVNSLVRRNFRNKLTDDLVDLSDLWQIEDADLSSGLGQIKSRYTNFESELQVSAGSGLAANYKGGSPTLETGLKTTIAPGVIALADNSVSYVFIDTTGVVRASPIIPSRWFPMAQVTTVAGIITAVVDLRERFKVLPRSLAIPTFGGGGYQGDLTISNAQTLEGIQYYDNFTLTSTGTISTGWLYIKARGKVTIDGAVTVRAIAPGVGGFSGATFTMQSYFAPGAGLGSPGGHNVPASPPYPWQSSSGIGSGGSRGYLFVGNADGTYGAAVQISTGKGGNGGGAIFIEAGGEIIIRGSIRADGEAATAFGATGVAATAQVIFTGNAGGTGGTVSLASLTKITITSTAAMSTKGGGAAASAVFNYTNRVNGIGGASGGYILLASPILSLDPNAILDVSGGAQGATAPAGATTATVIGSSYGSSFANFGSIPLAGTGTITPTPGGAGKILTYNFSPV